MSNSRTIRELQKLYLKDILLRRSAAYKKIIRVVIKKLDTKYNNIDVVIANDSVDDMKKVIEDEIKAFNKLFGLLTLKKAIARFFTNKLKVRNQNAFNSVNNKSMKKYLNSLEINLNISIKKVIENENLDLFLKDAISSNVELIKTMDKRVFEDIKTTVYQNLVGGVNKQDLIKKLKDLGAKSDKKAMRIATYQVNKINENLNKVRNMSLGIKKFIWQTTGSNKVRDEHASFDGKEFTYKDGAGSRGILPGQDVDCQCTALPVVNL